MYGIKHTSAITEGKAVDAIFNACRANPDRRDTDTVLFQRATNGEWQAVLLDRPNEFGVIIATAIVDEFDV